MPAIKCADTCPHKIKIVLKNDQTISVTVNL